MKEFTVIALTILTLAGLWFGYSAVRGFSCQLGYDQIEVRYKFLVGCQVKTSEGWVPENRYRAV